MKRFFLFFSIVSFFFIVQCKKEDACADNCVNGYCSEGDCVCDFGYRGKWCKDNQNTNNPNTGTKGTLTFWRDFEGKPIRITVDSIYRGQITEVFSSEPACNTSGTISLELNYGTYFYSAIEDSTGTTWSNTFSINTPCVTYRLTL